MTVFQTVNDIPMGFAGTVSRNFNEATIITGLMDDTAPLAAYGRFVKRSADGEKIVDISADSDTPLGVACRYFTQGRDQYSELPPEQGTIGILVRGWVIVELDSNETAQPKAGEPVYMCADGKVAVTAGSLTAVSGAYFTGETENGVAEIAFNL